MGLARFRPDQRAWENGDPELARDEKNRLEVKQRTIRKEREKNNTQVYPKWFTEEIDEATKEKYFKYKGGYWEARETGQWGHLEDIY